MTSSLSHICAVQKFISKHKCTLVSICHFEARLHVVLGARNQLEWASSHQNIIYRYRHKLFRSLDAVAQVKARWLKFNWAQNSSKVSFHSRESCLRQQITSTNPKQSKPSSSSMPSGITQNTCSSITSYRNAVTTSSWSVEWPAKMLGNSNGRLNFESPPRRRVGIASAILRSLLHHKSCDGIRPNGRKRSEHILWVLIHLSGSDLYWTKYRDHRFRLTSSEFQAVL